MDCLSSLTQSPPNLDHEVIVVDNDSQDDSVPRLYSQFPEVFVFENAENMGFAKANNLGIHAAQYDLILLLNPDTVVRHGAIDEMVKVMRTSPDAGGCGPKLLFPDGRHQVSCFPEPTLIKEAWRLFHGDALMPMAVYSSSIWSSTDPVAVDTVQGACLMLQRAALNEVGLLDEDYFMYTEEVDLCYRLRHAGWNLFWVPAAEVVHRGATATQQVGSEMFIELYRSKVQFFRKNRGDLAAWTYKVLLLLASLPRMMIGSVSLNRRDHTRKRPDHVADNYRQLVSLLPGL